MQITKNQANTEKMQFEITGAKRKQTSPFATGENKPDLPSLADLIHQVFASGLLFDLALVAKWRQVCRAYAMIDDPNGLLKWLKLCIVRVNRRYETCNEVKAPGFSMWCGGCKLRQVDEECGSCNVSPQRFVGFCDEMDNCQSRVLSGPGLVVNDTAVMISAREWSSMHDKFMGASRDLPMLWLASFKYEQTNKANKSWRDAAVKCPRALLQCLNAYFKHGGHILSKRCGLGECKCQRAINSIAAQRQAMLVERGRESMLRYPVGARTRHGVVLSLPPISPIHQYEQCRAINKSDGSFTGSYWAPWKGSARPGATLK